MDAPARPKRWTELARELEQAQRSEIEACKRASGRTRGSELFTPFNPRTVMGLPHLQEGRDEDM